MPAATITTVAIAAIAKTATTAITATILTTAMAQWILLNKLFERIVRG